jgi:hypothetical protein
MTSADRIYAFVFRGLLAKEAMLAAAKTAPSEVDEDLDVGGLLAIDALDERFVTEAKRMSMVYILIAAFENSVRELISSTLREEIGEQWWEQCVSEKIRVAAKSRMDEEEKVRWHTPRGPYATRLVSRAHSSE